MSAGTAFMYASALSAAFGIVYLPILMRHPKAIVSPYAKADVRKRASAAIADGLQKSKTVLAALDTLAAEGPFLAGSSLSLADLHLGAMIAYFTAAPEGRDELLRHPKLSVWWATFSQHQSLLRTDPGLPTP